jgi:short-subunit dehydrogenase
VSDVPLALVTGGTAGIGVAFADQLAADGHDLVLVARRADRLDAVAADLRTRHGVAVETLRADLTDPVGRDAVEARLTAAEGPPVDVLVSNAGVHVSTEFLDADLASLQTEVDVNVSGVLRMTHLALRGMVRRGHGSVILVSSFAGILPARGSAYGASRAWAVALADTLAPSLEGTGVRITVVCPGFVRTESVAGVPDTAAFRQSFLLLSAAQVARRALADHRAGRTMSVPGLAYRSVWTWLELPRRALRASAKLAHRDRGHTPAATVGRRAEPVVPAPRRAGSSPVDRQPTP